MFKKLALSSMMLLTLTPVAATVLPQATVSADTPTVASSVQSISGSFSGQVVENFLTAVSIGTATSDLKTVTLNVSNGGPTSLIWSAAIFDVTTQQYVSDWGNYTQGTNVMNLPVKGVSQGDSLSLVLRGDSGDGNVTLTVH